eukprot:gene2187-17777_t
MPQKSRETPKPREREARTIAKDHVANYRSLRNIFISNLIKDKEGYPICNAILPIDDLGNVVNHVIPTYLVPLSMDESSKQYARKEYWRSILCSIISPGEQCLPCAQQAAKANKPHEIRAKNLAKPAHPNAPVSKTAPERIKLTLQEQRLRCAELERQIEEMKIEIVPVYQ